MELWKEFQHKYFKKCIALLYIKKNNETIQVSVYSKSLFIQIYKGNKKFI